MQSIGSAISWSVAVPSMWELLGGSGLWQLVVGKLGISGRKSRIVAKLSRSVGMLSWKSSAT